MNLIVAVIHYPVYNKKREIVATSVTGSEIHDVSRTCMTFNVKLCYIVTPLQKQREIVERMKIHWTQGYGAKYNPLRAQALGILRTANSLDDVIAEISIDGVKPQLVGTSARKRETKNMTYREFYHSIKNRGENTLLLFGTGWGLTDETVERCDRMLEPISGPGNYNHLSMRVAMGIVLDRIFNPRGGCDE
ncbi:MAG: RNA methyltransferase [Deltaproteobacteria bacterium]|nr:RNA methyltransferase [Deltaproteobacteria bacterium]